MIRLLISLILYLISFFTQTQEQKKQEAMQSDQKAYSIITKARDVQENGVGYPYIYSPYKAAKNKRTCQMNKINITEKGLMITSENIKKNIYLIPVLNIENNIRGMELDNDSIPRKVCGSNNIVMNLDPNMFQETKFDVSDKDLTFEIKL